AEVGDGAVDERLGAGFGGDVVGVGDRRPAGGHDPGGDRRRRPGVSAGAVHRPPEDVDHHARAARREQAGIPAPDAAAGAGDYRDPPVEAQFAQAATGAWKPSRPPRVPPSIAARSSTGPTANCDWISWRLPR